MNGSSGANKRDVVLFLGAGFSYDAALPTMAQFWKGSELDFNGLRKHNVAEETSPDYRNAASLLTNAANAFRAFQYSCKLSGALSSIHAENLEDIFCVAEALKESGVDEVRLNGARYEIEELIQNIQLWIWKVYQQFPLLNPARDAKGETYNKLFALLKKDSISNRLIVLSTNYDLVYEYLAYKSDMPCVYSWGGFNEIKAGHGSSRYAYFDEVQHPDKVVMCKLHGSVNFFSDDMDKSNCKLNIANDLGDDKPIGRSGVWKDKPAIFAVDAIWSIRQKYGDAFTPVIIPPTYAKLTQHEWLRGTWNRAINGLRNAKVIIFMGYSFPDSDGFMSALMRGAILTRGSLNDLKIYVIDPKKEVHERYLKIFGSTYQRLPEQTLESALNNGALRRIFETL